MLRKRKCSREAAGICVFRGGFVVLDDAGMERAVCLPQNSARRNSGHEITSLSATRIFQRSVDQSKTCLALAAHLNVIVIRLSPSSNFQDG